MQDYPAEPYLLPLGPTVQPPCIRGTGNVAYVSEITAEAGVVALEQSQGFVSNSLVRRRIEAYGMRKASEHFSAQGYQVFDEHSTKPYDLRCTMGDLTLFVEVKGTQTAGEKILLTYGEVEFARSHYPNTALFLVSSVQIFQDDVISVSGGVETVYQPWHIQSDPEKLRPVLYYYTLAEDEDDELNPPL